MKIGFIGVGNMASAIIKGFVRSGVVAPDAVYLFNRTPAKAEAVARSVGGVVVESASEVIAISDVVMLGVKPDGIKQVIEANLEVLKEKRPVIVSMAAGVSLEAMAGYLEDESLELLRIMPNINVGIGQGATAVCATTGTSQVTLTAIVDLFEAVGKAWVLPEEDFTTFAALAGSSPAFVYLFIDSLARAGVKHGLPKKMSTEMAAQAVLGSASLLLETGEEPWQLIDQVCSPGGTTIAGLVALEDRAFMATVIKGIDETINREHELSEKP